jgi:RNA polymerase sigma factor (sigma-70 family)
MVTLSKLRMESQSSTWLIQITMNEARVRTEKRHRFNSIYESAETKRGIYMPEQLIEWRRIPSNEAERKQMRESLLRAFDNLPEKYREIFLLRDVQGLSIAQTAKLAGITENTVKTRLLQARLRMRELLSGSAPLRANAPVVAKRVLVVPCVLIWRKVSEFVDNEIGASARSAIELHIVGCEACRSVVEGVRNVVRLFGDPRLFPLPEGFRRRSLRKIGPHIVTLFPTGAPPGSGAGNN